MRIGIYGGSFDPIHVGHLILADCCREQLELDRVLLVPAATSPLKPSGPVATDIQRIDMIRLAIGGNASIGIDTCELDRGGISYTLTTVSEIKSKFQGAELFLLFGADIIPELGSWNQPEKIFELATPAVINRGGYENTPESAAGKYMPEGTGLRTISMPALEISSSDLRKRVRQQKSIRYRVPNSVAEYIRSEKLYLSE